MPGVQSGSMEVERRDLGEGIEAYAVDGYPADCVVLALLGIMRENPPDLVVSGINGGANVGKDWLGSGTVGAARVAAFAGFPALAVSGLDDDMVDAVEAMTTWVVQFSQSPYVKNLTPTQYLTISMPRIAPSEIKGVRFAARASLTELPVFQKKAGEGAASDAVERWAIVGEEKTDYIPPKDSDLALWEKGYIVIVPMRADEHDYAALEVLKKLYPS